MLDFNTLPSSVKRLTSAFLTVLILFVAAKFVNEVINYKNLAKEGFPSRTITVSGRGETSIKPNIGQVNFTVKSRGATPLEAQQQSVTAVNSLVAFLKEAGVEERDIKTKDYNISPHYDYLPNRGWVENGYETQQAITVKIRNLDRAGEILSGAAEKGATQVGEFTLTLDADEETARSQALAEAIKNARNKAEKLARELGVRLGRLVSFSEYDNSPPPHPLVQTSLEKVGETAALRIPEIPIGENQTILNVSLTYEIK